MSSHGSPEYKFFLTIIFMVHMSLGAVYKKLSSHLAALYHQMNQ